MGREASEKPPYEILAIITRRQNRILGGKALALWAESEEEQKAMTIYKLKLCFTSSRAPTAFYQNDLL
ncbi:hypothetical protein FP515_05200 [Geobacillus thermoleovorans]|uniref:capping complex subunit for YIEGIA n=1 Tax=Geobacillus TaxID=129337 RepID=UPI0004684640|nr:MULTISPECIES: hypothetical protein [Geobacillus]QDY72609.1 hypothetical protein FP515_05200 [Geobacillus thermoleovorans]